MQPIKINGTDTGYYFEVVPENATYFDIDKNNLDYMCGSDVYKDKIVDVVLPQGNWQIIGCITHDTVDEGCKVMAKSYRDWGLPPYVNYNNADFESYSFQDWQSSVRSLLLHNGIEIKENQKLLIVKKQTP